MRVGGVPLDPGADPRQAAETAARRVLDRPVRIHAGKETLIEATAAELGAGVDVDGLTRAIVEVGRRGGLVARLDEALEARRGAVDVPVRVTLPVEPLAERLAPEKDERDTPPVAAKLDFATHTATPDGPGRYLDVYAAAEAVLRAIEEGAVPAEVEAPVFAIAPRASSGVVAGIDTSKEVARFETRYAFLGDQAGRAQNIRRAAGEMDGVVLMPGEVVSFNANVGPRTVDNGFAMAPEIYKGELRPGIGGGTCQVSGTLHAAAFFGGIDVVERANHSRPSGYIRMGLDATVVYPTVDLKLRNPYDFPIVIHAVADRGTLTFSLLGRLRPATVTFDSAMVGTAVYKRKIEEVAAMPEGKVRLKQHGILGRTVKKTRTIRLADGTQRVEVTTDTYPPTFEIYQVGPGADLDPLPPLPEEPTAAR